MITRRNDIRRQVWGPTTFNCPGLASDSDGVETAAAGNVGVFGDGP